MLRIYLFGHLRVVDGEGSRPAPTPAKVADLWVYLLIHRGGPIPRDRVAFALWPDVPETAARANLRRHLLLLRRYLPQAARDHPWLLSDRITLQWNPDADYWLDVEAFGRLLQETGSEDVMNHLKTAIDLYQGDLLPDNHDEWVLVERERLRRHYTQAAERLSALQEEIGDVPAALATAQRLLARDRLREATHRRVMRLYYLAGDRAAALQQFDACQRLLREEMDVDPMPETLALRQTILRDPSADAAPQTISIPIPQPAPAPVQKEAEWPAHERASGFEPWPLQKRVVRVALILLVPILALFTILIATGFFSSVSTRPSQTVTLSGPDVARDTWITAEYPDTDYWPEGRGYGTYDTYAQVHLQYYEQSLDRFLIRLDLESLPPGIEVQEATLRVHLETWTADVGSGRHVLSRAYPATVSAYQVYRPWPAKGTTYVHPWSQPGLAPGVDFGAAPLDSQVITDTAWLHLDVTEAVRTWLARPEENQGLALKISEAPEGFAHYWVYTTESKDAGLRPQLAITYVSSDDMADQVSILTGEQVTDTGILSSLPRHVVDDRATFVRLDKGGLYAKALLHFDLRDLPRAVQIAAAELVVYLEPSPPSTRALPATIAVHQLTTAWEPDTVTFDYPWAEPGLSPDIDYGSAPLDVQAIRGAAHLTFDVTAAVQVWQNGENHGLLVTTHEAPEGYAPYRMHTSESPDPASRPQLRIRYRQD